MRIILWMFLGVVNISLLAQEKLQWQEIGCDTTFQDQKPLMVQSILRVVYKSDFISDSLIQRVLYGEKSNENDPKWVKISKKNGQKRKVENDFLDSLSVQFLGLLLPKTSIIYHQWEPWLAPVRNEFIIKRNALFEEYQRNNSKIEMRLISDLRTRADQQYYLQNGQSSANLSFHEMGLASDVGFFKRNRYLRQPKYYMVLDKLTHNHQLQWGGNFVGFVDPPHMQYYKNSAELIRKHPYLSLEFDYFYNKYLENVWRKIAIGEEFNVEDSKELLVELNAIRKKEGCFSEVLKPFDDIIILPTFFREMNDILIYFDQTKKVLFVKYPKQDIRKFVVGSWK